MLLLSQVAMVMLLLFLELGRAELLFFGKYAMRPQQEEDGHGHTPSPLRTRRPDLLFSRRYTMSTSTALY